MGHRIGIVGAGVAGLHLALYLQQHGVEAVLITDRTPEAYRDSRLLNTVAHHHVTLERERRLGLDIWSDPGLHYTYHDHVFAFPEPIRFRGDFSSPSRAVDYRLYLPALMEVFAGRGGRIEYDRIGEDEIPALAARFDLLVVAAGRGPLGQLFGYRPEHSPYTQPQRRLCVGLYTGVRQPDPMNVTLSVSPGHGEMIVIPTVTFDGIATALLMENVPGGAMEGLAGLSYDEDPAGFRQAILDALEAHHPTTYDRIDTARFDLAQPQDLLQGGVVPTVRQSCVSFDDGPCAIALGDVHSVVDPMMGQGANIASYAAFVLGEEIVAAEVLDERFCEKVDLRRQDRVLAAARWTNLMLQPPSESMGRLIGTMAQNKALADEFTENFNYPERQWDRLSTPARIDAWIDRMAAPERQAEAVA